MLIRSLAPLLAATHTAYALRNTSPFFLLSTDPISSSSLRSSQLATAASVEEGLASTFDSCDSSLYIVVEQDGAHASDLQDGSVMPGMRHRMQDNQYKTFIQIPEVMGVLDVDALKSQLGEKCESQRGNKTAVLKMRFPTILESESETGRRELLRETDAFLENEFPSVLANHSSHVLIFTSKPASAVTEDEGAAPQEYEMDEPPFHQNMHTDLKRDVEHGLRRRQTRKQDDFQKDLPLFERYQFLSPGIFMGLFVSLLLFMLLYIGISAISGLEVSYMAFSKEMGPQAQKKQQ